MANSDKYVNFATPKGVARFPKIIEPDTKGKYADNKHKTELIMSAEDLKAFKAKAAAAAKQLLPGVKNPKLPFKVSTDKKTGETVESFIAKSTKKPWIGDAKKTPINPKNIGPGSVLKIGGSFAAYEKGPNKGITAYLDAVQVIELKEGFDASALFNEEDGYVADEEAAPFSDESGSADVMEL
jgi:DNA-directed RNA polymerase